MLVHEVELINAVIDNKEIVEIGGRRGERVEEASNGSSWWPPVVMDGGEEGVRFWVSV